MGGPDPEVAENWLAKMIDIFIVLNYPKERQVNFATFQFEGLLDPSGMLFELGGKENKTLGLG